MSLQQQLLLFEPLLKMDSTVVVICHIMRCKEVIKVAKKEGDIDPKS